MNKQFYRSKFNAKLGTYVAVSELAKSHNGDTSARVASSIKNTGPTAQAQGQRTLKQLVIALSALMAFTPVYANVTANKSAPTAQQPTVLKADQALNVWISTPSKAGVSRNSYSQFDVNQHGVILNNARAATTSKITNKSIAQNPNLATGAATTIINEVVSTKNSVLQGNVEVLGQKANIVIANPSGITVNGGGFINANQVTLSTGAIGYHSDGSIKQHEIRKGTIIVNADTNGRGLGGNNNNPTTLELLGRSIDINAPVNAANGITAISGTNNITSATGELKHIAVTDTKPTAAIDVAQVGGLYANSIYLYANEAGVGVNNAGIIKAKNNLVLNSNGKITNTATGTIQTTDASNGLMSIQTNRSDGHADIVNQGKIQSSNALFIDAGRNLTLEKDSYTGVTNTASTGIVSINATGNVTGTGAVVKQLGNDQDIYITADGTINLSGKQGNGSQNNIGSNGGIYLNAGNKIQITDGLISGRRDVGLYSGNQLEFKDSNLYSRDTGLYLSSVGTDIANATITLTNAILDAKTNLVVQSGGDLNITKLNLPLAKDSTQTRVTDVTLIANRDLSLNQNDQKFNFIRGHLNIQAGEKASLQTGLTNGESKEVKAGKDLKVNAKSIETKNIGLAGSNIDLIAQNSIKLDTGTSFWTRSGDVNLSALGGGIVIYQPNISATANVNIHADGRLQIITPKVETAVSGTTLKNINYNKGSISGKTGVNISSLNHQLDIDPLKITSSTGDIQLGAKSNLTLYAKANEAVSKNSDGTFKSSKSYIGSDLEGQNINLSANGQLKLDRSSSKANAGHIIAKSTGHHTLINSNLTAKGNIELHSGNSGHLTLRGVNANATGHMALSSNNQLYINSFTQEEKDANGQVVKDADGKIRYETNWSDKTKTNLTSGGVLSVKSNAMMQLQDFHLTGGAVNIDAGSGLGWKGSNTIKGVDSELLRKDTGLSSLNGDVSIQSNRDGITFTPTNTKIESYGDIDIRAKKGTLTFAAVAGTKGNGSEQVVSLNTANGGIYLEGKDVKLEASQLTAKQDINVIANAGDVVVDGVKNTLTDQKSTVRYSNLITQKTQIEAQKVAVDKNGQYEKDKQEVYKAANKFLNRAAATYNNTADAQWGDFGLEQDEFYTLVKAFKQKYGTTVQAYEVWNDRDPDWLDQVVAKFGTPYELSLNELQQELNFFDKSIVGYEHTGSNIKTTNGNINLASSKGVSISGAIIDASKGKVNIEAAGTLATGAGHNIQGIYNNSTANSVKQGNIKGSIIIDATQDSYELGKTTDGNYAWRSPVNSTSIHGDKGVTIQSKGKTATDNLILQGVEIRSNGDVNIEAYKNIIFDVAIDNSYDKSTKTETKRKWYGKKTTTTTVSTASQSNGVSVDITGKNVNIKSEEKNTANVTGKSRTSIDMYSSQLTANGGKISIQAGGDLNFLTANDITQNTTDISKKSSWVGITLNKTNSTSTRNIKSELPAVLKADYIGTKSGLDTRLKGTEFHYLEGATIEAGGTITLEGASTIIEDTLTRKSNSVVWQSMQDKGTVTETAKLPSFNGPTVPKFSGSLTVQVPVAKRTASQKELVAEIEKLAKQPGNAYLQTLIDNKDQKINWEQVILTNEQWDYKSQGLTGAGAAIIAIIVAIVTYGAGTALVGTTAAAGAGTTTAAVGTTTVAAAGGGTITTFGGMTLATTTASTVSAAGVTIAGVTTYTATGAMVNAALTSLATQASISAVNNGGNVDEILKDLGSKESIKSLATTVLTVGVLDKVGSTDTMQNLKNLGDMPDVLTNLGGKIGEALIENGISTGINLTINGGNLSTALEQWLLSSAGSSVQGMLSNHIKLNFGMDDADWFDSVIRSISHAAAGCIGAKIGKQECEAGAIGAVVGEAVADLMKTKTNDQQLILDVSSGLAAGLAGLAGYDVNTAKAASNTAIQENAFWVPLIAAVVIADKAYSAYQITQDVKDVINGKKTPEKLAKEKGEEYVTKAIVGNLGKKGLELTKEGTKWIVRNKNMCSFRGDMEVKTLLGYRPIQSISEGDWVYSLDEYSGQSSYKQVLAHYSNPYKETVYVTIKSETGTEQTIVSNKIHPFFTVPKNEVVLSSEGHIYKGSIKGGQWVDAANLTSGDQLLDSNKQWQEIVSVVVKPEPLQAYNLTVDQTHTYFIKGLENGDGVWVHNDCLLNLYTSSVKKDPLLLKEARKLSNQESAGINSLLEQINKGNNNPGIGTKVFNGITEFRHKDGGRIYAKMNNGIWEILAYSGKGNQQVVINQVVKLYGKK